MCEWPLFLLLLLLLTSGALCSSIVASNDRQLVAGLRNPEVDDIILPQDLVLQASTWSTFDTPVSIARNLTIRGGSSTRLFVIDLNYVPCVVSLLPGVTLTFENVEIRRARRGMINKVDLVCQSYHAVVLLKGVAIHALSCVPRVILFDPNMQLPRPEGFGPGPQQLREISRTECPPMFQPYCSDGFSLLLWVDDHAYTTPVSGTPGQSEGGYVLQWIESVYSCDDLLTVKCLKEHGMDGCISLYYLSRQSSSFSWYLGFLLVAGAVILLLWCLWGTGQAPLAAALLSGCPPQELPCVAPRTCTISRGTHSTEMFSKPSMASSLSAQDEQQPCLKQVSLRMLVGVGSFGKVYQGRYMGEVVAVKVMSVPVKRWQSVVSEVELSLSMRHPNVLRAIGYFQADDPADQHAAADQLQQQAAAAAAGSRDTSSRSSSYSPWGGLQVLAAGFRQRPGRGGQSSGSSGRKDSRDMLAFSGSDESKESAKVSVKRDGEGPQGRGHAGPNAAGNKGGGQSDGSGDQSSGPSSTKKSGDTLAGRSGQEWGGSRADSYVDVWLVTEYCRLGTLSQAILDGLLDASHSFLPDMRAVLRMAHDIASGMAYLHSRQVLHGDLKCENVLLAEAPESSLELVSAKVADFGLSRSLLAGQTHLSTQSHGTVTHMAPELLENGRLSRASDVYSFGILLWELVNRKRPFEGQRAVEVMMRVVHQSERPEFPVTVPRRYVDLAKRCWDDDPHRRPAFREVLQELEKMIADADGDQSRYLQTL